MVATKQARNGVNAGSKWKIPPTRIESDECVIYTGRVIDVDTREITEQGTPHYVHVGEWVELIPCQSLKELIALQDIQDNASGSLKTLCDELSKRVTDWNWTGIDGEALPQPYKAPDVLEGLITDELMWLLSVVKGGETSDTRKND
jgi:hypothetical protein